MALEANPTAITDTMNGVITTREIKSEIIESDRRDVTIEQQFFSSMDEEADYCDEQLSTAIVTEAAVGDVMEMDEYLTQHTVSEQLNDSEVTVQKLAFGVAAADHAIELSTITDDGYISNWSGQKKLHFASDKWPGVIFAFKYNSTIGNSRYFVCIDCRLFKSKNRFTCSSGSIKIDGRGHVLSGTPDHPSRPHCCRKEPTDGVADGWLYNSKSGKEITPAIRVVTDHKLHPSEEVSSDSVTSSPPSKPPQRLSGPSTIYPGHQWSFIYHSLASNRAMEHYYRCTECVYLVQQWRKEKRLNIPKVGLVRTDHFGTIVKWSLEQPSRPHFCDPMKTERNDLSMDPEDQWSTSPVEDAVDKERNSLIVAIRRRSTSAKKIRLTPRPKVVTEKNTRPIETQPPAIPGFRYGTPVFLKSRRFPNVRWTFMRKDLQKKFGTFAYYRCKHCKLCAQRQYKLGKKPMRIGSIKIDISGRIMDDYTPDDPSAPHFCRDGNGTLRPEAKESEILEKHVTGGSVARIQRNTAPAVTPSPSRKSVTGGRLTGDESSERRLRSRLTIASGIGQTPTNMPSSGSIDDDVPISNWKPRKVTTLEHYRARLSFTGRLRHPVIRRQAMSKGQSDNARTISTPTPPMKREICEMNKIAESPRSESMGSLNTSVVSSSTRIDAPTAKRQRTGQSTSAVEQTVPREGQTLACARCNAPFTSVELLKVHVSGDHLGYAPYRCENCPYLCFPTEFTVIEHNQLVHGAVDFSYRKRVHADFKQKESELASILQASTGKKI